MPNRVALLTRALTTAIRSAHDNEVFVVVAELLADAVPRSDRLAPLAIGSKDPLEEFLDAVGLARAKHHRVVIICPSPTFVRPQTAATQAKATPYSQATVAQLRTAAEHIRLIELAAPLKRRLTKLGVPMTISGEPRAMRMVLSEIDIARSGRLTPRGAQR
jgi:hypothetical protein